jgi:tetratricopeptide (TPR) repeat protein
LVRAGQAAERAAAPAEALEHYQRALELWDQVPGAAASSPLDRVAVLDHAAVAADYADRCELAAALGTRALGQIDAAAEPPTWERARVLTVHGRLLMTMGRRSQAMARCEEAIAVARQVGARAEEGYALNVLGTSLCALGRMEAGTAYLEQAREIASELGEVADLVRAHINLATVLEKSGRCAEAADAYLAGLDVARRLGAFGNYGPFLLPDAATALLSLGRREEAGQLLAEAFELVLESPADRLRPLIARGNLRLWDGDLAAAQADFGQILAESPAPLDPLSAAEVLWYLTETALWDGRLPDGRAAGGCPAGGPPAADGLTALAGTEEPYCTTRLCGTGLAVEAAAVGQARHRRSGGEYQAVRERAAGLLDRIRSVSSR